MRSEVQILSLLFVIIPAERRVCSIIVGGLCGLQSPSSTPVTDSQTLGKLEDPRAAEPLAVRLGDDPFGRAVQALIAIGPPAEAAVIEQLKNPDPGARKRACEVLKEIGGMDSLIFMRDAKPDPDTFVRWAAQDAIKAIVARVGLPPSAKPATKGARRRPGL